MQNTRVAFRRREHAVRRQLQPAFNPVRHVGYNGVAPVGGSDTSDVIVTFSTTTSGGTLLVVVAGYFFTGNFAAGNVTDDKGNVFALDFQVGSNGEALVAFYSCSNFVGGGPTHNITVSNTQIVGKAMGVIDYYTTLTKDRTASSLDDATSPHTSGTTATQTTSPGIAMAGVAIDTGSNAVLTEDADWTLFGEEVDGTLELVHSLDYKLLLSTAAEDAGWTWTGAYVANGAQAGIVTYYEGTAPVVAPWRTGRRNVLTAVSGKVARA